MIIKEQIEVRGRTRVPASHGATVIAAGVQYDRLVVWVDEPYMDARIGCIPVVSVFTGDDAPADCQHLATVQNNGIVVHVYVEGSDR